MALVVDETGNELTAFFACQEQAQCGMVPLPCSLVALWSGPMILLVFDNARQQWELPGGMIDPGESPREAAVRELWEESGQHVDELVFAGHAQFRLGPERRLEFAAVFTAEVVSPASVFVPSAEIADCCWWDWMTPLPGNLGLLDLEIARLARRLIEDP